MMDGGAWMINTPSVPFIMPPRVFIGPRGNDSSPR